MEDNFSRNWVGGNGFGTIKAHYIYCVHACLVAKSCPTHAPIVCNPPGFSAHGILQARLLEWFVHYLLQGIVPIQGPNLRLLCWQEGSLPLSHQGNPVYFVLCF